MPSRQATPYRAVRRRLRVLLASLLAAGVFGASATPASAGNNCPGEGCTVVRPCDEVLLVSVRRLGCSTNTDRFAEGFRAWRYDTLAAASARCSNSTSWQPIAIEEVIASVEPSTPTIVFAHGNRVEANEIRPRGLWVYSRLLKARCDDRPLRFIIFSWPADEVKGMFRDVQLKAARTKPAGFQLAWLLNQTSPDAPLGMLGYSFGSRVLSGATHLLAGGSLGRLSLPTSQQGVHRPMQSVYIAGAFDSHWLGRGRYHGRSLEVIDNLLVTTNRRDPAMRYYELLDFSRHPQAMGFAGPTCLSRERSRQVRLMNVTQAVGKTHDMCTYMQVGGLMRNAWRRLTFADAAVPSFDVPTVAQAEATVAAQ